MGLNHLNGRKKATKPTSDVSSVQDIHLNLAEQPPMCLCRHSRSPPSARLEARVGLKSLRPLRRSILDNLTDEGGAHRPPSRIL